MFSRHIFAALAVAGAASAAPSVSYADDSPGVVRTAIFLQSRTGDLLQLPLCDWERAPALRCEYGKRVNGSDKIYVGGGGQCVEDADTGMPTDDYFLLPRYPSPRNLAWREGRTFNLDFARCSQERDPTNDADFGASMYVPAGSGKSTLVRMDAFTQYHPRSNYLRGTVMFEPTRNNVKRWHASPGFADPAPSGVDLVLQAEIDGAWVDLAVRSLSLSNDTPASTRTISAYAPPFTPVRFELRAKRGSRTAGLTVQSFDLFVETCIPDPEDPGECVRPLVIRRSAASLR